MDITMKEEELRKLLDERDHLRRQVDDLQNRMSEMIHEGRGRDRRVQVTEFHNAMKLPVCYSPAIPAATRVRLRCRLVAEETFELLDAAFPEHDVIGKARLLVQAAISEEQAAEPAVNFPEFIDALGDIDYVVEGSRIEFGVDGVPIAREIHRANMAKVLGGTLREDGKVLKPKDWRPPDIVGVLRLQGWRG